MPKVYKFTQITETGPNGSTKSYKNTESNEIQFIGSLNGEQYISVPDSVVLPAQEVTLIEVTDIDLLKTLQLPRLQKESFRNKLELEVGDVQDLLADCMKMCEFALVLSSRIANEVLSGTQMPEPQRSAYTARVAAFVGALDSGLVKLRSDSENPADMMMRLMTRYTKLNALYETEYKANIDKII